MTDVMVQTDVALRCAGVGLRLGEHDVLSDIDLEVRRGEVLALVGPNGAGKSTLLGVLSGDVRPDRGSVLLDGEPISDRSPGELARRRSVLLQDNRVSFGFSVRAVVEMGRMPWVGESDAEGDDALVADALRRTDMHALAHRSFQHLSGGERARASMARVLAQDTSVVLLDEPTAALDLRHTDDLMQVANDLAAAGKAVVVVLHDLSLAAAYADRIGILHQGRLTGLGAPEEVLRADLLRTVYQIEVRVFTDPDGAIVVQPKRVRSSTSLDG